MLDRQDVDLFSLLVNVVVNAVRTARHDEPSFRPALVQLGNLRMVLQDRNGAANPAGYPRGSRDVVKSDADLNFAQFRLGRAEKK